jgi:hypothetical protein
MATISHTDRYVSLTLVWYSSFPAFVPWLSPYLLGTFVFGQDR